MPRCRVWPIPSSYPYLHVGDDIFQFPIPASSGRSLPAPNLILPPSRERLSLLLLAAHCQLPILCPPIASLRRRRADTFPFAVKASRTARSLCLCLVPPPVIYKAPRLSDRPRCRRPQSQPYREVAVSLSRSSACHLQGAPSFRSAPLPSPNFFHRPTDRCGRRPFQIAVPVLPVPYLCVPTMDKSPR